MTWLMGNETEEGRHIHAVITGCDDIWHEVDAVEKKQWAEEEAKFVALLKEHPEWERGRAFHTVLMGENCWDEDDLETHSNYAADEVLLMKSLNIKEVGMAKNSKAKERLSKDDLNQELKFKTKDAVKAHLAGVVDENFDRMYEQYQADVLKFIEENPEGDLSKCKFKVGMSFTLCPRGGDVGVFANAGFSTKVNFSTEEQVVSVQPELAFKPKADV